MSSAISTRESHLEDIVDRRAAAMPPRPDGLVPWRERPLPFRKGVVSRTPPLVRPSPEGSDRMLAKTPVTIVTGFLGAGKTTLIRHFWPTPAGAGSR